MLTGRSFTSAASWSYSVAQQSLCLPLSAVWDTVQRWTVTALHSTVSKHFHTDDLINKQNKVTKPSISHFRYRAHFCTLTFSRHTLIEFLAYPAVFLTFPICKNHISQCLFTSSYSLHVYWTFMDRSVGLLRVRVHNCMSVSYCRESPCTSGWVSQKLQWPLRQW